MYQIVDFNFAPYSIKNGMYGGLAGQKDGIIYNNENYMLKYPKYVKNMDRVDISYSTSPLCEFIGSHVYEILGYDVHKTILGEKNEKIVVACKDLENDGNKLIELRTIKNHSNAMLSELLDKSISETGDQHYVNFEHLMLHLEYNPILLKVENIKQHFWEQAIIDIFINNSDRNNGNWGLLRNAFGIDSIAPIFDNGGSFQDKLSEEKIERLLKNKELTYKNASNTQTAYAINGHVLSTSNFLALDYQELRQAIIKVVPNIYNKFNEIIEMINNIPEKYICQSGKELLVCSQNRKQLFELQLKGRFNELLLPTYNKTIVQIQEKTSNCIPCINEKIYMFGPTEREYISVCEENCTNPNSQNSQIKAIYKTIIDMFPGNMQKLYDAYKDNQIPTGNFYLDNYVPIFTKVITELNKLSENERNRGNLEKICNRFCREELKLDINAQEQS